MRRFFLPFSIAAVVVFTLLLLGCNNADPTVSGGPVTMRRLTPEQYRNAIEDSFGTAVEVAGRFEPDNRRDGLNALGTALVAVTPSGFEQYEAMARNVAAQVVSPEFREALLPCQPASLAAADDVCAARIIRQFGRQLLRRPLSDEETRTRVAVASATSAGNNDFYSGLEVVLTSLMVAPDFLFRVETANPAPLPEQPGRLVLSSMSLASRLSYFLWNRGPDADLLAAAERGELAQLENLTQQVDRLLASEHLQGGVQAFFEDLFMFDLFDDLGKDVSRYPLYNIRVAADAREQTLRFVVDHLVGQQGDFRQLFTSR